MNVLDQLGQKIQRDVRALMRALKGFPPSLDAMPGEDLLRRDAAPGPRRPNPAPLLVDPLASAWTPAGRPTPGVASSAFGPRFHPILKRTVPHNGEDIAAPEATTVTATAAGVVLLAGMTTGGYGNLVAIDHGDGVVTRYAHLASILVRAGETVTRGSTIGTVGRTGRVTGPHLHYEVIVDGSFQDPAPYLALAVVPPIPTPPASAGDRRGSR